MLKQILLLHLLQQQQATKATLRQIVCMISTVLDACFSCVLCHASSFTAIETSERFIKMWLNTHSQHTLDYTNMFLCFVIELPSRIRLKECRKALKPRYYTCITKIKEHISTALDLVNQAFSVFLKWKYF